jgi:hypothetical protein
MYATAVEPHWCEIRPWCWIPASQFKPVRPPKYDMADKNSEYCKALMEVKTVGENLTDEQKHIADFWDDNPFKLNVVGHVNFATKKFSPPGHWMNIVGIGAKQHMLTLRQQWQPMLKQLLLCLMHLSAVGMKNSGATMYVLKLRSIRSMRTGIRIFKHRPFRHIQADMLTNCSCRC